MSSIHDVLAQYPAGLHYVQRVAELEAQSDELKQQGAQVRTKVDMFITFFFHGFLRFFFKYHLVD